MEHFIFETERLIVRRYHAEEFEHFFLLNGDEEVVRYIRKVQTREEAMLSFQSLLSDYETEPGYGRWAVHSKENGEFIGSFAIIPIQWDKEKIQLGYAFPKKFWGMGYATELTVKGLEYAWKNTSLPEIYAVTEMPNIASQKVLLKTGFQPFETRMENDKELQLYIIRRQ
jgi:ribosomal-protein-alanine N-acetyltransferase